MDKNSTQPKDSPDIADNSLTEPVEAEINAAKNIVNDNSAEQNGGKLETIGRVATNLALLAEKEPENLKESPEPIPELPPATTTKRSILAFRKLPKLPKSKLHLTKERLAFAGLIGLIFLLFIGGTIFNMNKKTKAVTLDNKISIAGIDVSGQTPQAAKQYLKETASKQKITLLINGKSLEATPTDIGLERNIDETVNEALKSERVVAEKIGLRSKTQLTYSLKTTVNKEKLNSFISSKLGGDLLARNAQLVVENNAFVVKPGQTGLSINISKLISQINSTSLASSPKINTDFAKTSPEISDETANKAKQTADSLVAATYTLGNPAIGNKAFGMNSKVKWVSIQTDTTNQTISVNLNKQAAEAEFEALARSFNRSPKNLVKVNIPSAPTVVLENGYDGISIPNEEIAKAKTEFIAALEKAQPAALNMNPTITPKAETTYDGQKKMVLIDLTRFTAYAVEESQTIKTVPITSGKRGFETPTGTFVIGRKTTISTMSACSNGECWRVPNIRWQSYFTNYGHAIHATTAPASVGRYNISHGCVGMYEADAHWFFDWATPGTPVVIVR